MEGIRKTWEEWFTEATSENPSPSAAQWAKAQRSAFDATPVEVLRRQERLYEAGLMTPRPRAEKPLGEPAKRNLAWLEEFFDKNHRFPKQKENANVHRWVYRLLTIAEDFPESLTDAQRVAANKLSLMKTQEAIYRRHDLREKLSKKV